MIHWLPPPGGTYKVNIDGVFHVGTGHTRAGGLIRDHLGRWAGGFNMNIGFAMVTGAELWGLLQGLMLAWNMGLRWIQAEVDSESVIKCIGEERQNHGLHAGIIAGIQELKQRD
ncbi:OLC1v1012555C1 [Oldenlandia corymbosa var. corymbosa]|uniref:OLC1v1012555C1 n=1 Tax=Oldenlandia corymbosa var. corymbosa TaxID=529605 RepID=A0AAV1DYP5_OLDCO|nr:OLC1v1012555C1 [Oldenlandia corymbosa var. corymbosa]